MDRIGQDWTRINRIGQDWTRKHRIGQDWTGFLTAVHSGGMNGWVGAGLKVPRGLVAVTSLDFGWLNGWLEALVEGSMGGLFVGQDWTRLDRIGQEKTGLDRIGQENT